MNFWTPLLNMTGYAKKVSSKASKKYKEYNYLMMNKENSQKLINIVKKYIFKQNM